MEIFLYILYAAIFSLLILRWKFFEIRGISRYYILGVFGLKLIFGFGLSYLYSSHYNDRTTGDTYRFFDDAKVMYSSLDDGVDVYLRLLANYNAKTHPDTRKYYFTMTHMERPFGVGFYNDNVTIIQANAFIMLFSFGYYHVHVVFWCFMALIGLTALLKTLVRYFPRKKVAMFFSVYLLPTVLFWGSGVMKEPILLLGMGLFLHAFFKFIYGEFSSKNLPVLIFGLIVMILIKGYVLICMAPAIVGLLLVKLFRGRHFWGIFAVPHVLIVLLIFLGPYIHAELDIAEKMRLKQEAFYHVAEQSESGSTIEISPIERDVDLILNAPEALTNTYLKPWPWQWDKALYIPPALENLFLLVVLGLMIWNFRKPFGMIIPIIGFCLSFVLILGIVSGESVPVLGALVRYKMPGLIFLYVLIFGLTDHIHLQRRLPVIRRVLRKL